MHDAAFAESARPSPVRLLGFRLRPYSVGHELILQRQANPLAIGGGVELRHLLEAVLICSQTWKENDRMASDPFIGLKLRLWKFRVRRENLPAAVQHFRRYREHGTLSPPCSSPIQKRTGRKPGSPFMARLALFLFQEVGVAERDLYDYPLGLAQFLWAAHWEGQGCLNVQNQGEMEFEEYVAKQEALESAKGEPCPA